jgi:uncharacterized protein (TIGR02246 family)
MRRTCVLIVCAVLLTVHRGSAQPGSTLTGEAQQVALADKTWVSAWQACQVEVLNRLMPDDVVIVQALGTIITKAQFIDMFVKPCTQEVVRSEPVNIRVFGDSAVAVMNMTFKTKAQPTAAQLITTRVYVKRDGKWSMIAQHSANRPQSGAK